MSKAPGAPPTKLSTAVFTNAVVANCVVLVPAVAVGAVGVPEKTGVFKGAFVFNVDSNPLTCCIVKSPFPIVSCFPFICDCCEENCVCIALVTPFKYDNSVLSTEPSPTKFAFNRADEVIDGCFPDNAVVTVL